MKKQRIKNALMCILNQSQLKMKITFLLIFVSLTQLNANTSYGQDQKVTIMGQDISLNEVFYQIEKQTGFHFFYNGNELDINQKISLNIKNQKLSGVLTHIFKNKPITYRVLGNQIVLTGNKDVDESNNIQNKQIKGSVKDKTGMPLTGVTVVIEGTQKGVVTNYDGSFKIDFNFNENVLVFSSLGYKTQRIELNGRDVIDLVMEEDFSQLEEVVLIGYGEQNIEEVSGAVSSIKPSNIVQAATGTIGFDRALGGLVKGVNVSQSSGRPGSPVRLNIRGITSPLSGFGGLNQPLYVIDGVPFNIDGLQGANPLLTLNPNDIESFDVLKDAAATAIYGSRGANGVIIVQTKRGERNQKNRVNVSYTTTLAQPINTVSVLNASQYRNFYDTLISNSVAAMNAGQIDPFFAFDLANIGNVDIDFSTFQVSYNGLNEDYFGDADTDWNKEVFRSLAVTNQANISLNGGTDKNNYALSLAFIDQEGLTIKDGLKQYTLSMSLDTDLTNKIKIGATTNLGHVESNSGEDDLFGQYTVNSSIARARPDLPVYDTNGELLGQTDFSYGFATLEPNPIMRLQNKTKKKNYNFIGNAYIEIEPVKNLKLKADVNTAVFYTDESSFIPKITQTDFVFFPNESFLSESTSLVSNVTSNLTANYSLKLSNNRIGLLLGAAWDRTNFDLSSQFYTGFPDDDILINGSSAESVGSYSSNRVESGLNSLFSRVNYSYKNLYSATFNFRTDVSSKFGPSNQRAYFPSLSVGWNIANENFLADSQMVNVLKLRASAGRVGSTNVSNFAYLQFFQKASDDIYNGNSAIVPNNNFPNTNIGWEETEEVNIGLDFSLLNSRLRGSVDVYNRKTIGALANTPLPLELGPNSYFSNFVDVSNKGIEVSLGGDIIKTEDFIWSTNINWSLNRNKLDKLNGANINPFQLDYFIEGEPVGTIKGYRVVKIFQDQAEVDALNAASPVGFYDQISTSVGDYMYEDVNGDGQITTEDRVIIGDIEPDYFGGISNTFQYKNFALTALMQYSVGGERTWSNIPFGTLNILGENKYSEYALNTWTPETPNARYARALYFDPSASSRTSDRYLYDTSYLRLKSLQLSYNLDGKFLNKLGITSTRFVLAGTNLVTWTNWPGMDPETFSERGGITDQVDNEDPYPLSKSFSLGVQVQF
ncbi:TonB-dependent receptor [Aestuariibaculum sp. M13]|uniref:TonB-dependent receptor n=1 Tax=Aestuariibaculum sp. M13 TaxID=2967132 RepID=UPI002159FC36|nr:TonB-dependent receptor [Aestuariibaculum sp. M13]MCR8668734.1 TonB-dependent receptor [Aestuariibaculum sp. M13]